MRHAIAIDATSTAGSVYEKFHVVFVDGFRYPIEAIHALVQRPQGKSIRNNGGCGY